MIKRQWLVTTCRKEKQRTTVHAEKTHPTKGRIFYYTANNKTIKVKNWIKHHFQLYVMVRRNMLMTLSEIFLHEIPTTLTWRYWPRTSSDVIRCCCCCFGDWNSAATKLASSIHQILTTWRWRYAPFIILIHEHAYEHKSTKLTKKAKLSANQLMTQFNGLQKFD